MPVPPLGAYRQVVQSVVTCPDFRLLSATARHVLLTLKLCPENQTALNLFRWYREVVMAHTGLAADALEAALRELETCRGREGRWLYRDPEIIWLCHPRLREPHATADSLQRNPNEVKRVRRLVAELACDSRTLKMFLRFSDFAKALPKPPRSTHTHTHTHTNTHSHTTGGPPSPGPPGGDVGEDSEGTNSNDTHEPLPSFQEIARRFHEQFPNLMPSQIEPLVHRHLRELKESRARKRR